MPVKAYIYAEDGALLGYLACLEVPPDVMELGGRYFKFSESHTEVGEFGYEVPSLDYREVIVEDEVNYLEVCVGCGRNSSMTWWKCCPEHCTLEGLEVYCQSCVEKLHPGEEEFARQ